MANKLERLALGLGTVALIASGTSALCEGKGNEEANLNARAVAYGSAFGAMACACCAETKEEKGGL